MAVLAVPLATSGSAYQLGNALYIRALSFLAPELMKPAARGWEKNYERPLCESVV